MKAMTAWLNAVMVLGVVMALTLGAANNLGTLEVDAGPPADTAHVHLTAGLVFAAFVWLTLGAILGAVWFLEERKRRLEARHPYRWRCQRCPFHTSGADPIVIAQASLKHAREHHDHHRTR